MYFELLLGIDGAFLLLLFLLIVVAVLISPHGVQERTHADSMLCSKQGAPKAREGKRPFN